MLRDNHQIIGYQRKSFGPIKGYVHPVLKKSLSIKKSSHRQAVLTRRRLK